MIIDAATIPLDSREARRCFNSLMFLTGTPQKVCTRCHAVKSRTAFAGSAARVDGLNNRCRECDRDAGQRRVGK